MLCGDADGDEDSEPELSTGVAAPRGVYYTYQAAAGPHLRLTLARTLPRLALALALVLTLTLALTLALTLTPTLPLTPGVYMHGGTGCGKTMMVDRFFAPSVAPPRNA